MARQEPALNSTKVVLLRLEIYQAESRRRSESRNESRQDEFKRHGFHCRLLLRDGGRVLSLTGSARLCKDRVKHGAYEEPFAAADECPISYWVQAASSAHSLTRRSSTSAAGAARTSPS